jgi:putative Mg2+ transporter-C (MgtC) family protein
VQSFLDELASGLPDSDALARIVVRLVLAALLGAVVGIQRELVGKPAGLRTHMLVALGAALFVLACLESGMAPNDLSRVIQGLATGIGFLGGGAILKVSEHREISGLTTAAGIWLTAAVGVTVGLGQWGLAAVGALLTWMILAVLFRLEPEIKREANG